MEIKTMVKLAGMTLTPVFYNRHIIKVHPKYLFSLVGFGIGSLITFIIIIAEELNNDVSTNVEHSQIHHLAIPILFGLLGMITGYFYGKKRKTKEDTFQELFANLQTTNLVLDHLPVLVSYLDTDLRYRYANKTYEKWMGLSMNDVYGKHVKDIVVEKTYDALIQYLPKAWQGETVRFDTSREMNGKEQSLHVTLIPHLDESNSVKGFFSVVADVSRLRKRENKIRKQKEKLEELNATKDKFFSIIAHDLKNPFNATLGFLELLHQDYETLSGPQKREIIDLLYENSQNTYKLLENLLEWARTQSGAIKYTPSPTDVKALVDENINLFQPAADKKGIRLNSSVSASLFVTTDPDLLKTVVRNLVSNAIKFTPEKGEVSIAAIRRLDGAEKEMAEISVSDSGIGISPENQKKLFTLEKNFGSKGTANETGTGLGLILCKEFVEKCGGHIWAESEVGKGSVFHISIPGDIPPDRSVSD